MQLVIIVNLVYKLHVWLGHINRLQVKAPVSVVMLVTFVLELDCLPKPSVLIRPTPLEEPAAVLHVQQETSVLVEL